jgi:hypothetical protein
VAAGVDVDGVGSGDESAGLLLLEHAAALKATGSAASTHRLTA